MEWIASLFVLAILLCTVQSCPDFAASTCTVTVGSLDDLYSYREGVAAENDIVCVDLDANSTPNLTYRDTLLTFREIIIRGNGSLVTCNGTVEKLSYTHFPLRFQDANLVAITNLSFEACERPLQFKQVKTVLISDSSFR